MKDMNSMGKDEFQKTSSAGADIVGDSEIFFLGMLIFIKRSYKDLVIGAVIGILCASTYVLIAPNRYEAVAKIYMAQMISQSNINNSGSNNTQLVNVEDPNLLTARFSSPSSYTEKLLEVCAVGNQFHGGLKILSEIIKLSPLKGVPSVVELKVLAASPEVALACANETFDLVRVTQTLMVKPYIESIQAKLVEKEQLLAANKELLVRADKSGGIAIGAVYLSTKDEIHYLQDQIAGLQAIEESINNNPTHLVSPAYVSNVPVSPKKLAICFVGLLGGIFLGILSALIRKTYVRFGLLKRNLRL
jgi:capsular polysaccharide biosynthesis protein